MATNRIRTEYKNLLTSKEFQDLLNVTFVRDNMYNWIVQFDLTRYEIHPELKKDFDQLASLGKPIRIEYEVIFSDDYPMSPPFFRVVSPRFMY